MRKINLFLFCCVISGYCFAQSPSITDSTKIAGHPHQLSKGKSTEIIKPEITIYPNPANNKVTLQVKYFDPGMAVVRVLDIKGKLIREDNRLLTNGTEDIIMFLMLKAGVYFIMISEPGKVVRKKLVIL